MIRPIDPLISEKTAYGRFFQKLQRESKGLLMRRIFMNPIMWVLAFANYFVYIVRYALYDWGPNYLQKLEGIALGHAGLIMTGFEIKPNSRLLNPKRLVLSP